ncbi:MAG: hypothetical protein ACETWG_02880 [Candidatus Neomarinimicrobiota bacterium]
MIFKNISFIFLSIILVALFNCENYQTDEERTISEVDQYACDLLQDTLFVSIAAKGVTNLQAEWVDIDIGTVTDSFDVLTTNTSLKITYPIFKDSLNYDTSYVFYDNSNGPLEVVLVFTDFWGIEFLMKDGSIVEFISKDAIDIETVASCTELVEVRPQVWAAKPIIKTRYVFELEQEPYLARFIKMEATQRASSRAAIVENY